MSLDTENAVSADYPTFISLLEPEFFFYKVRVGIANVFCKICFLSCFTLKIFSVSHMD